MVSLFPHSLPDLEVLYHQWFPLARILGSFRKAVPKFRWSLGSNGRLVFTALSYLNHPGDGQSECQNLGNM